ncbi:MAG: DUF559 domain-containing protein [Hyphomonadaceae bacterium]|nr:DUF559 domain-containing protein [Hyphomonadaceae bacterium]
MRAPVLTFKRAGKLRRTMSPPEVALWQKLRGGQLNGLRFRRQHPIGPYILDFYCPSARLAVEVDGQHHNHSEQAEHDTARTSWLSGQGIVVLRFATNDILDDRVAPQTLSATLTAAAPSTAYGGPPPPRRG